MRHLKRACNLLLSNRGATATEYSLLSCLLCLVMLVGVTSLGDRANYYAFGQLSHAFEYGGGSASTLPPPDCGPSCAPGDPSGTRSRASEKEPGKHVEENNLDTLIAQR